jgi:hypothetical protein
MKKLFSLSFMMLLAALVASSLFLSSCDGDDPVEPPPPPPKLDGLYVFGTNTVATLATDAEARLALAVLDPGQGAKVESMDGVYGKFMYIGANSTISFMEVAAGVATTFGAENGGTVTLGSDLGVVLINDNVIHGTLLKDGPAIKVANEGLYYLFLNKNDDQFVLMPVKPQIIGDATKAQWASGTSIPVKSVTKTGAVFEATNLELYDAHGYRYRFNDGWHTYNDENIITLSSLGVPSYGDAWATGINDIGFYLDNAPHKVDGVYTVTLEFDAATGEWTETKTKTGNLLIDYSGFEMGLFGNAYFLSEGVEGNWGSGTDGYGLHVPVKAGNVYTWTWSNVNLIQDREFIFLEDGTWGGLQIDYLGAANGGAAVTDGKIVDATTKGGEFHNYFVVEGGSYTVTMVINAETTGRTITFVKN